MTLKVVLVTIPATILMGVTFPVVTSLFSVKEKVGRLIGNTYAINTIGSIIGPIIVGFLLLPFLGTTKTILFLALSNLLLSLILILLERKWAEKNKAIALVVFWLLFIVSITLFFSKSFLEKTMADKIQSIKVQHYDYLYQEDETAAVLAYADQKKRRGEVMVNGTSMTGLGDTTKFMAHLPLFIIPHPKKALVICFGMGTTFRSALTWGIEVQAIELVPSVIKAFPLFYNDAVEILKNPKGRIIINDGRNYVFLTSEKYDLITIDPPPPINSAQTTVLYSKEFYEQAKQVLTENGIVTQWIFVTGVRKDDIGMLVKSFIEVFPETLIFRDPSNQGIYLLGSEKEINIDKNIVIQKYKEKKIFEDINEYRTNPYTVDQILELYLGKKDILIKLVEGVSPVTDDRPITEYFLLRKIFSNKPILPFVTDVLK